MLVLTIYILTFTVGFPANIFTFATLLGKARRQLSSSDVLLLNLTAADLLLFLFLPFKMAEASAGMTWPFPVVLCPLANFCFYSSIYLSSLFLAALSLERYLGVVFPIHYKARRRPVQAMVASVVIWLLACSHCSVVFVAEYYGGKEEGISPSFLESSSGSSMAKGGSQKVKLDGLEVKGWSFSKLDGFYLNGSEIFHGGGISTPNGSEIFHGGGISTLNGSKISNLNGPRTSNLGGPKSSNLNSPKTSNPGGPEMSNFNDPKTSNLNSPKTSNLNDPKSSNPGGPRTSDPGGPKSSNLNSPKTSTLNDPKTFNLNDPKTSNLNSLKTSNLHDPKSSNPGGPGIPPDTLNTTSTYKCYDDFSKDQLSFILPLRLELFLVLFLLPFTITIFCSINFVKVLLARPNIPWEKKHRALGLALATMVNFGVCFAPFNISHVVGFLEKKSPDWRTYALLLTSLNATLDPVIFYFSSTTIQKAMAGVVVTLREKLRWVVGWLWSW
ncbi:FFAR3 protein, partial [Galbula dea]|nr:FFAR3 protein [Galbula dea]